jgi:hypothetical protein
MENKDQSRYNVFKIIIVLLLLSGLAFLSGSVLYSFILNPGQNGFGNLSSYYLPIFSFGNNDFPPLEF